MSNRVWIYQASRKLAAAEEAKVLDRLKQFTTLWKAHGKALAAQAEVRRGVFVIIQVDESVAPPTGCSIDKSVHLLQEIGEELGIDFFDRMTVAFENQLGEVELVGRTEFETLLAEGKVDKQTLVFNNLISRSDELESTWRVPLKDSWHIKVFGSDSGIG